MPEKISNQQLVVMEGAINTEMCFILLYTASVSLLLASAVRSHHPEALSKYLELEEEKNSRLCTRSPANQACSTCIQEK